MLRVSSCCPVGCVLTCSQLRPNVNRVQQLDGGGFSVCVAVYFELLFRTTGQPFEFGLVGVTVLPRYLSHRGGLPALHQVSSSTFSFSDWHDVRQCECRHGRSSSFWNHGRYIVCVRLSVSRPVTLAAPENFHSEFCLCRSRLPLGLHVGGCLLSLHVRGGGLLRGVVPALIGLAAFARPPIPVSSRFRRRS